MNFDGESNLEQTPFNDDAWLGYTQPGIIEKSLRSTADAEVAEKEKLNWLLAVI